MNSTNAISGSLGATGSDQVYNFTVTGTANAAPTVNTPTKTSITYQSATLGGTVTSNGGATLIDRGVYYQIGSGVTTGSTKLSEGGTSVSSFTVGTGNLLSPQTNYFYKAYATNSIGTSLGATEDNFYTLSSPPTGIPTFTTGTGTSISVPITVNAQSTFGAGASAGGYAVFYAVSPTTPAYTCANGSAPVAGTSTTLFKPNEGFISKAQLPRKTTIYAGTDIAVSHTIYLTPIILYTRQFNLKQLSLSGLVTYKKNKFSFLLFHPQGYIYQISFLRDHLLWCSHPLPNCLKSHQ